MRLVIAGGTGLVGRALVQALASRGFGITVLTRSVRPDLPPPAASARWDPARGLISDEAAAALASADAVVNLAGRTLQGRWSAAQKAEIRESRVLATELLGRTLAARADPLPIFISASAVGYYGDQGERVLTEASPQGPGFLAAVCGDWEEAAAKVRARRVVRLRIGLVLARDGGALARLLPLFRLGLGGPLGSGRQWVSWIALPDLVEAIAFLLEDCGVTGAVNAVSPNPVRTGEFARALAETLGRRLFLPVPPILLRLAFGEMADELLLSSQRVLPEVLSARGFVFRYPDIAQALSVLVGRSPRDGSLPRPTGRHGT